MEYIPGPQIIAEHPDHSPGGHPSDDIDRANVLLSKTVKRAWVRYQDIAEKLGIALSNRI